MKRRPREIHHAMSPQRAFSNSAHSNWAIRRHSLMKFFHSNLQWTRAGKKKGWVKVGIIGETFFYCSPFSLVVSVGLPWYCHFGLVNRTVCSEGSPIKRPYTCNPIFLFHFTSPFTVSVHRSPSVSSPLLSFLHPLHSFYHTFHYASTIYTLDPTQSFIKWR
jgi:hypothetical protein